MTPYPRGSSPLARGALEQTRSSQDAKGLIPAGAGSTLDVLQVCGADVHFRYDLVLASSGRCRFLWKSTDEPRKRNVANDLNPCWRRKSQSTSRYISSVHGSIPARRGEPASPITGTLGGMSVPRQRGYEPQCHNRSAQARSLPSRSRPKHSRTVPQPVVRQARHCERHTEIQGCALRRVEPHSHQGDDQQGQCGSRHPGKQR